MSPLAHSQPLVDQKSAESRQKVGLFQEIPDG